MALVALAEPGQLVEVRHRQWVVTDVQSKRWEGQRGTCGWRIANQPRNPLRLSSLVILGVVARMSRCATRSSYWFT